VGSPPGTPSLAKAGEVESDRKQSDAHTIYGGTAGHHRTIHDGDERQQGVPEVTDVFEAA
jgi:hypothetical protein